MSLSGNGILTPVNYMRNRAKEMARRCMPASMRFTRAGESALRDGEREVHEIPRLVVRDSVAVDVGAHIGDYTYALCKHIGPHGRVIAIEPLPDLANMLSRAVKKLRLPVTVIRTALSSREGEAELTIPMNNGRRMAGYATLEKHGFAAGRGPARTVRVPLRRLDDICKDVEGRISFIKIDVEGHELEVLRGATETLRKHRSNLIIEIEQRHSTVPIGETFAFIQSQGYRGEFLDKDRTRVPLERFDPAIHQQPENAGQPGYLANFIFLPNEGGASS